MGYQFGSSYFVSATHAFNYYKDYIGFYENTPKKRTQLRAYVSELLADGTIHVGKPPVSLGQVTGINAEGRYMVRSYAG